MDKQRNIRNISVVAHVDHGKSTLTDSLLFSNGIISKEDVGTKRGTDTRPDEALRGITIKSTGVSLHFEMPSAFVLPPKADGREFLINLIDSPGHVDFSSEVTAALRLTDGALVLVDCVEGVCVQTETVLRQALAERVRPVLAINKLDRAFVELQLEPEEMFQSFSRSIESVNTVIATFHDETMGDLQVYPDRGTVCFSAGKQGWAFTLRQFARMYSKKSGVSEEKMVERLWGDHFYDDEAKMWTTSSKSTSGKQLIRGFCKYIIEPISKVFKACLSKDLEKVDKLCAGLGVTLSSSERGVEEPKDLLKNVMQKWLPASDALLEMVVTHLPSPVDAQKYRVENLYTGPLDDITAESIRKCDPEGPLVMYISKMIPTKDGSRFFAFGRVFSGTVSCQRVRVMGANFIMGEKNDLAVNVPIQRIVIMMADRTPSVDSVPCGNTCSLVGIDSFLAKSGTVVSDETSHPLVNMKYSVSPVVRVAVKSQNPADLPKLVEGLRRLSKSDPLVQVIFEPTGEHVIAASGELHLEITLADLKDFCHGIELIVSYPVVPFQETVTIQSNPCMSKSPSNLNRLTAEAMPLGEDLVSAIEKGVFVVEKKDENKIRMKRLETEFGWDPNASRKVWAFGPETLAVNALVDMTKGIQYMNEVKENVVSAFRYVSSVGVLAEEKLRGVRFNILDAVLHKDNVHRGAGQIIPASRRVFYASQMSAKPRLLEPVYLVDILCSSKAISGVYATLNQRRGVVTEALPKIGTPLYMVKGYLPVSESFGFVALLRSQTSGQAFPQLVFDHWEIIEEDPLMEGTRANQVVKDIRKRKGLEIDIPKLDQYLDKL